MPSKNHSVAPSGSPTFLPTCAATNFVNQVFFNVIGTSCYRFQFFTSGTLDTSSDAANCDAGSFTPTVNLSIYAGISGNKFLFTAGTGGYTGDITIRLDSSTSSPTIQIVSLDTTGKTFVGNLLVSSC